MIKPGSDSGFCPVPCGVPRVPEHGGSERGKTGVPEISGIRTREEENERERRKHSKKQQRTAENSNLDSEGLNYRVQVYIY